MIVARRYWVTAIIVALLVSNAYFFQQANREQKLASSSREKIRNLDSTGTEDGYIKLPEAGVKMQLPQDLKDIVYFYNPKTHGFFFSTKSLMAKAYSESVSDQNPEKFWCSLGNAPIGIISFRINDLSGGNIVDKVKIDDYYFFLEASPGKCGKTQAVQELQDSQSALLRSAFTSLVKYKDIKFEKPQAPDVPGAL